MGRWRLWRLFGTVSPVEGLESGLAAAVEGAALSQLTRMPREISRELAVGEGEACG